MGEAGFWAVVRERLASAPFLSSLGLQRAQEEGRVCQEHGALGKPYSCKLSLFLSSRAACGWPQ